MLHKRVCKHCAGQFQPIRTSHLFCSDTCRKLANKAKNRAISQAKRKRTLSEKLKKLANSAIGLYLVKEIKRASTVEILKGHNSDSLTALVSLRRRCTAAGGYENGESLAFYELSHIYPVRSKDRVGLLNSANLAITPKTFNRKHGNKVPVKGYLGSSTPKSTLLKQWMVDDSFKSLDVLKLARKYIGEEFDIWLKKHLISQTQRQAILKNLKKAGYDYELLENLGLKQLKAIADEDEIPYFSINKEPDDLLDIVLSEIRRFNLNQRLEITITKLLDLNNIFETPKYAFKGSQKDLDSFTNFICETAILSVHGQPYTNQYKLKSFGSYFKKNRILEKSNKHKEDSDFDNDIL